MFLLIRGLLLFLIEASCLWMPQYGAFAGFDLHPKAIWIQLSLLLIFACAIRLHQGIREAEGIVSGTGNGNGRKAEFGAGMNFISLDILEVGWASADTTTGGCYDHNEDTKHHFFLKVCF